MTTKVLQNFDIIKFQQHLLTWYAENKRDLPWRESQDPYKIWVSEIMLQQTKVDTVIPYFNRFITKYPTVYDLAKADEQDVLKAWEGLGYYSRARNLQHAVKEVVADYDGIIPDNPAELGALKGIGPYTRGAILSIAFDQAEPAVDGNVMRVLSRVLHITDNISEHKVRKSFEALTRELVSKEDPSSFNQGIMELGALICTPKAPLCLFCPVQEHCRAYDKGVQAGLPVKAKAKPKKTIHYAVLLIKSEADEYMIEQRPSEGLLASLWQFPMIEVDASNMDGVEDHVKETYGLDVSLGKEKAKLKHVFTHLIWQLKVYDAELLAVDPNNERLRSVQRRELRSLPFPVAHLNIMPFLVND